ncbi:hypothetical protein QJQ45_020709 [Haematococcus lacustris]|nr:hypothetical protein QJQ45_020709 [Haematococcus lacustris]
MGRDEARIPLLHGLPVRYRPQAATSAAATAAMELGKATECSQCLLVLTAADVEAGAVLKSGTSWVLTATVLLGDMFGLGQLTLPQTFARLGYAPASALLLVFCVLCCYSGFLYQRLAILCPEASLFDQVARRAMGRTGVALVWGSMYLAIFLCPLIFQITCAEALKQVGTVLVWRPTGNAYLPSAAYLHQVVVLPAPAPGPDVTSWEVVVVESNRQRRLHCGRAGASACISGWWCYGQVLYQYEVSTLAANLAVALMIIPLAQVQHLEDMAWVCVLGTAGMVAAVVVVVGKLSVIVWQQQQGSLPVPVTHAFNTPKYTVALVGIMDVLFCYGGQPNWWRYITSMAQPRHFSRASGLAILFMTLFYCTVAAVGYSALGDAVDLERALTSLLAQDAWTALMNTGLFVHCLFAYQINLNVWASSLLELLAPHLLHPAPQPRATAGPTPSHPATTPSTVQAVHAIQAVQAVQAIQGDSHTLATSGTSGAGSAAVAPSSPALTAEDGGTTAAVRPGPLLAADAEVEGEGEGWGTGAGAKEVEQLGWRAEAAAAQTFHPNCACPPLAATLDQDSCGQAAKHSPSAAGNQPALTPKQAAWACLTCSCVALSVVGSCSLPFFSIIMAVIASSGDFMGLVGLPCLFSLYLVRDMSRWEVPLCWTAVLLSVVGSLLGLQSALQQLLVAVGGPTERV